MKNNFNAELHARPSIYFSGPAFIEHVALIPQDNVILSQPNIVVETNAGDLISKTQVEFHTEFVTVTRVTQIADHIEAWPALKLTVEEAEELADLKASRLIYRAGILVQIGIPTHLGDFLKKFSFGDTAASMVGGNSALVCSDFQVCQDGASRILVFNNDLSAYRLGRMIRRLYEIETYRTMALLALPEARYLTPLLGEYDCQLAEIANRNASESEDHKMLLDEISDLSAHIISASAGTRARFGATFAYSKIVEERISELREEHVAGYQRYGVFVGRRFRPAIRTCEATAQRLEQMSLATMHLIDLLQTRIQVEVEIQNAKQIQTLTERTEAQIKIQRAVEGFSIIAISYYCLGLLKSSIDALNHAGYEVPSHAMLVIVPIAICAVAVAVLRVKKALAGKH